MGIDFRVGEEYDKDSPHWSYSGFNRFRSRLAKQLGYDWELLCAGQAEWPKKDALYPFLFHSDCDGEMSPAECATVGPRLREVLLMLNKEDHFNGIDYDQQEGAKLLVEMEKSVKRNEPLIFC